MKSPATDLKDDAILELEKKFIVRSEADLSRIETAFLAMAETVLRRRAYVTSLHYYDTPARDLLAAGVTLRKMDACPPHFAPEIDVKTIGRVTADGALVREEHPFPMVRDAFRRAAVNTDAARALLKPAHGKRLTRQFSNDSHRRDIRAVFDAGNGRKAALEICVERTDYKDARGKILKSCYEVEIEYSQAQSDAGMTLPAAEAFLNRVARAVMHGIDGVTVNTLSKAEMGFALTQKKRTAVKGLKR